MRQDKHGFFLALLLVVFGCDSTPEVSIDTPVPADTVAEAVAVTVTAFVGGGPPAVDVVALSIIILLNFYVSQWL